MYPIIDKKIFTPSVFEITLKAPQVAAQAKPGQFCIVMSHSQGERVPFTIADSDPKAGTITLVIQVAGKTSHYLMHQDLEHIAHVSGPLGEPSVIHSEAKHVALVGGGLGVGAIYPIMKAYHKLNIRVTAIVGFRSSEQAFWMDKLSSQCNQLIVTTDDGSLGNKGRVTDPLKKLINEDTPDLIVAIGPLPMMKAASEVSESKKIKTYVSLNPIMVDGIGMCGACRVTINGETRYACIEGPEFDAHDVDFDELITRNNQFLEQEETCYREYMTGKKHHDH